MVTSQSTRQQRKSAKATQPPATKDVPVLWVLWVEVRQRGEIFGVRGACAQVLIGLLGLFDEGCTRGTRARWPPADHGAG